MTRRNLIFKIQQDNHILHDSQHCIGFIIPTIYLPTQLSRVGWKRVDELQFTGVLIATCFINYNLLFVGSTTEDGFL